MKTNIRKNKTGIIGIAAVIACAILLVSAPAFAEIVLEIHSDDPTEGSIFTDSAKGHPITIIGGAKHSTLEKKFGASSMLFNGDGDYLSITQHSDFDFDTNDFTVDFWFNSTDLSNGGGAGIFVSNNANNSNVGTGGWNVRLYGAGGTDFTVQTKNNGVWLQENFITTPTVVENVWYHVALVRTSSTIKFFLNGTQQGGDRSIPIISAAENNLQIGKADWNLTEFAGYIDDLYIRKGEALDTNQLASIVSIGGEAFEHVRGGINTTLGLGYSTAEIDQLAQLYAAGAGSVSIGGLTWSYMDGILPGDFDGTTYTIGQSYMYGGKWYIKLGSGLEGAPEVPLGAVQMMVLILGFGAICKRRFLNNSLL